MLVWKLRKIFHTVKILFTLYNHYISFHQKAIIDRTEHSLEQCKKRRHRIKRKVCGYSSFINISYFLFKTWTSKDKTELQNQTDIFFFLWAHHLLFLSISVLRSHWFLKLNIFLSFLRLFQFQRNIDKTAGNISCYLRWIQGYLKLCSILTEFACLVTMRK